VGYLHEGLSAREQANVHDKFVIEAIQVCFWLFPTNISMCYENCHQPVCWVVIFVGSFCHFIGLSMKSLQLAMSIQGCVAPSSMCWGMTLSAHLVVILGS